MLDTQHEKQYVNIPVSLHGWGRHISEASPEEKLHPTMTFCHSHYHPEFEILVIPEGRARISINGQNFVTEPGDIVLINPYDVHYGEFYTAEESFRYCCTCFSLSLLGADKNREYTDFISQLRQEQLKYQRLVSVGTPLWDELSPFVNAVFDALQHKPVGWELAVRGGLFSLFSVLRRYLTSAAHAPDPQSIKTEAFVRDVLAFVEEHYREPISTRDAAALFSYNENYFCRLFRQHFSRSFGNYLSAYRIQRAKELLVHPQLSISQVANEVGYNNLSYFSRAFYAQTGELPSEYRRKI